MKKNTQTALNVVAIVVGMLGLAYASVPLYNLFCRMTGFGGTPKVAAVANDKIIDKEVTVLLNTDVDPELPWSFKPLQSKVKVKLGESKLIFFEAENLSDKPITGISLYNVTPPQIGQYFNKTQCFCFDGQLIPPHKKIQFPVSFFIDPEMINNENLKNITQITLSYTFFEAKNFPKNAAEKAE